MLGMIFVHVPDGLPGIPVYSFDTTRLGFFVEGFLVEGPGRASAALLSVVSGYLAAIALLRRGGSIKALYSRRFSSIVVPMVFWGLITYAVYLGVSLFQPTFLADASTLLDKLNIVFFITEMPMGATMHLGFLRDLFVCILLSPALLFVLQRAPWLVLPALAAFYLFEHDQAFFVMLRPLILFAFSIGMLLAIRNSDIRALDRYSPLFVAFSIMATAIIMMVNGGAASGLVDIFANKNMDFSETVLYPLSRLFGSLAIWTLIPHLMGGQFQSRLLRLSPYLFAAFCSHYLVLTLLFFGLWQPLFGDRDSILYVMWFFASPMAAMVVAVCIVKIACLIAPPLATMLTGGRVCSVRVSNPLADRQRQGIVLGLWLAALHVYDRVASSISMGIRDWWAASRRL